MPNILYDKEGKISLVRTPYPIIPHGLDASETGVPRESAAIDTPEEEVKRDRANERIVERYRKQRAHRWMTKKQPSFTEDKTSVFTIFGTR